MNAILQETVRDFAELRGLPIPAELIVDGFAGGGGASEGIEEGFRRLRARGFLPPGHPGTVSIAINHDEAAIAMHAANHPDTLHLPHDIWKVNPLKVTNGLPVGFMWASPDCRHHSKAKGGRPVSKSVRDLAWVVAYWGKRVRPRRIALENVEEFRDWGPLLRVSEGVYRPDPARKGDTFDRWVGSFVRLGYKVELRLLRGCDYGDPTIRKRLFVIMACDGEPIVWPQPTHGDPKSEAVRSGRLKPWKTTAGCIDWELPCPSILLDRDEARAYTKATGTRIVRPLARNTMARIAKGVKRYVLDAAEPFIVTCNHGGEHYRGQGTGTPFATVTRARDAHGLVVPSVVSYYGEGEGSDDRSAPVDRPLNVVTTAPRHALVDAEIAPFVTYGQHDGGSSRDIGEPLHTVEASPKNTDALAAVSLAPFVSRQFGKSIGGAVDEPSGTITAGGGGKSALASAFLVPRYGERPGQEPRTRPVDEVGPTIVPTGNGGDLAAIFLAQHNGDARPDGSDGARPGRPVDEPLPTATTRGTQAQLAAVFLAQNNTDVVGHDAREPASTIVGKGSTQSLVSCALAPDQSDRSGVIAAHMLSLKGSDRRASAIDDPHPAVTAQGKHSAVISLPLMTAYYGNDQAVGSAMDEPSRVVTGNDRFGFVVASATPPPLTPAQLARARQVAAFLREFGCWDGRELVTVTIKGVSYVVVDIGMRMLTARELARAQGFPDSYILAAPYRGGVLSDTEQRHKIGNSVNPGVAAAIFEANYRPRPARWQPTQALRSGARQPQLRAA